MRKGPDGEIHLALFLPAPLLKLVTKLTKGNSVPQTTIVSAEDALEHLNGTLNNLNPANSCVDGGETLTASRLEGKTFGVIKSDEILIFQFAADGSLKDGEKGTWSLNGNTLTFGGSESFTACSTSTSVLLEKGEGASALYDVKPYRLPASMQSFVIAYDGTEQAVLTIKTDGSLDYFPAETFNDRAFVYRNEEANETIIHAYNSDGIFEDFKNDCYEDGQQDACYSKANWPFNKETQTLTEEYSATNTEKHKVAQSGAELYLADTSVEDAEIESMRKTNPIGEGAFAGSYTIDIPTENTRFNNLTVNANGDCIFEGMPRAGLLTSPTHRRPQRIRRLL